MAATTLATAVLPPPAMHTVGGRFAQRAVTFSRDGKAFFACAGAAVKVFSVATGELLHALVGHAGEVTGCVAHPANALQLITASMDGSLRVWDFVEGTCLRTLPLGHPALHLVAATRAAPKVLEQQHQQSAAASASASASAGAVTVYVHLATAKKRSVWAVNLGSGALDFLYSSGRVCRALAVSPKGLYLASVNKNELYVFCIAARTLRRYAHARDLTTLAFHPTDPYLVTGAVDGQLLLWFGFAAAANLVQPQLQPHITTSVLHWHAHAVAACAFSEDGAYLLSGGEEAVLVLWQLETGHRQFLPRLGAPINGIAVGPKGALYALSGADNAVRLVGAVSSKVERTVRGLQCSASLMTPTLVTAAPAPVAAAAATAVSATSASTPSSSASVASSSASSSSSLASASASASQLDEHSACGLMVDPRSGLVLLGGLPGQLQLFDAVRDRHVAELPVVARQFVSRTETVSASASANASGASGSERAIVQHAAIHAGGDWLATIESRPMRARAGGASAALIPPSASASALLPIASEADDGDEAMVLKFWRYDRESHAHAPVAADPASSSASSSSSLPSSGGPLSVASSSSRASFALNTRVDQPHKSRITCVAFHPTLALCVTASTDRTFKLWRQSTRAAAPTIPRPAAVVAAARPASAGGKGATLALPAPPQSQPPPSQQVVWSCQSVGFYRHEPIRHASFSPDGTLLAACSGATVTLWDPAALTLLRVLPLRSASSASISTSASASASSASPSASLSVSASDDAELCAVRAAYFLPSTPFLVAHSASAVYVWNLLTLALWWQYDAPVRAVAAHASGCFVVLCDSPSSSAAAAAAATSSSSSSSSSSDETGSAGSVESSLVLAFHPSSPTPLRSLLLPPLLAPPRFGDAAPFLAFAHAATAASSFFGGHQSAEDATLLALTAQREVLCVPRVFVAAGSAAEQQLASSASSSSSSSAVPQRAPAAAEAQPAVSMFQRLYGGTLLSSSPAASVSSAFESDDASASSSSAHFGSLFSAPTHAIPSLSALYASFMQSFVGGSSSSSTASSSSSSSNAAAAAVFVGAAAKRPASAVASAASDSSSSSSSSSLHHSVAAFDARLFAAETTRGLFQWADHQSYAAIVGAHAADENETNSSDEPSKKKSKKSAPEPAAANATVATTAKAAPSKTIELVAAPIAPPPPSAAAAAASKPKKAAVAAAVAAAAAAKVADHNDDDDGNAAEAMDVATALVSLPPVAAKSKKASKAKELVAAAAAVVSESEASDVEGGARGSRRRATTAAAASAEASAMASAAAAKASKGKAAGKAAAAVSDSEASDIEGGRSRRRGRTANA